MNSNSKAFTLVELVVVIGLCVILTVLLTPTMHSHCHSSRRANCMSNARQIGLAFKQYAVDHNDSFPSMASSTNSLTSTSVFLSLTNGGYLQPGKIYVCPSDMKKKPFKKPFFSSGSFTSSNNSYACVVADATGTNGMTEGASSDQPLIFDEGLIGAPGWVIGLTNAAWKTTSAHKGDGGNIFYVGGQAGWKKKLEVGGDGTNGYVVVP